VALAIAPPESSETTDYCALPCGVRMPSSVHAVSVSLPTLDDLIGYETGVASVMARTPQGYPRFHVHPYISKLTRLVGGDNFRPEQPILAVSSQRAAAELCGFAGIAEPMLADLGDFVALALPDAPAAIGRARAFLQHTGHGISSRCAEDFLIRHKVLTQRQAETAFLGADPAGKARAEIAQLYGADAGDVALANTGMNAIYAAYRGLGRIQAAEGRHEWVQFGWLFMDTIKIIEKLKPAGTRSHVIASPLDLDRLENLLRSRGGSIAGIFTETPSNPLLQTPDVERLRRLADRYDCALVIDATLGTPVNVDVLPWADVVVESLTKYASGSADLMMGALIVNRRSRYAGRLAAEIGEFLAAPYERDVRRLAHRLAGYRERMHRVNQNTMALVEFFEGRPSVGRVRWAYQPGSRSNYEKIHRGPQAPGGIITLELTCPLATIYDPLRLPKGPTLGVEFTLIGPYLYHSHYDLVSTEEGRSHLRSHGLDPDLLRVSVGIEDPRWLERSFAQVM